MDKKTLFVFFVILILIAFFIWFGKGAVRTKEQPVLQEINQEQQGVKQESLEPGYTQNSPSIVNNSPGITIIKKDNELFFADGQADKSRIEKGGLSDSSIIEENQKASQPVTYSGQSYHNSGEETVDNTSADSILGVTKLNKRPTEEESREMNAQGIILY